jgi:hypothetical protein
MYAFEMHTFQFKKLWEIFTDGMVVLKLILDILWGCVLDNVAEVH